MFGIDFAKSLQNKRKKLECLADDSLAAIDKKVMEMVQTQQQEKYVQSKSRVCIYFTS